MLSSIQIHSAILSEMTACAKNDPSHECCGLLAGQDDVITHIFRAVNAAKNPATEYEIAPEELFRLMRVMRSAGLDLMGIYHSHPNSKNKPSARDIAQAYYPAAAYFILSARTDAQEPVRAFSIQDRAFAEMEIQIL